MAFDFKKEYKDLYMPTGKPSLIEVPPMNFIMVDGSGDPNDSPEFEHAVTLLYGLSYAIRMSAKKGMQPEGYFEYVVPPLEGLWWVSDGEFCLTERNNWLWTVMIRQPDFVTDEVFGWASAEVQKKKPELAVEKARLEEFEEGLCAQIMHRGPYADEPETMKILTDFMEQEGLKDLVGPAGGKHHEIYLSDPRKAKPEKMKTVLRHPVTRSK